jgi:hypothetical protein
MGLSFLGGAMDLKKRKFFVLFFDDTEMSIFSDLMFLKYHDAFLYIIDQPTAG